jgi:hypothetical protein
VLLSEVFEYLSDPDNMAQFLGYLEDGLWDEWDCGIDVAGANFGPKEFAIAARSAKMSTEFAEGLEKAAHAASSSS